MRKIIITILMVLATCSCAYATNEMGWTAGIAASLTEADDADDTKFEDWKTRAIANSCSNDDFGLQDAIMYKHTGDPTYCTRSFSRGSTSGCDGGSGSTRNKTRDCFVERAVSYSWCADAVSAGDKTTWTNQMNALAAKVQSPSHGTGQDGLVDTDEIMGHYFGCTIYDIANDGVLDDCTTNGFGKSWGGVISTGTNRNTVRNAVGELWTLYGDGGSWVEGSEYNNNTIYYTVLGVHAINDSAYAAANCSGDCFPEITSKFDDLADVVVQQITPDFSQYYQWGDVQSGQGRNINGYRTRVLWNALAFLDSQNPNLRYILDSVYVNSCSTGGRMPWIMFYDYNSTRTAPSGQTSDNANGMGLAFWHEDWTTNGTAFYSEIRPRFKADHDWWGFDNFNVWRNNGWSITNPKWYYSNKPNDINAHNSIMAYGAYSGMEEASGQYAYESGNDFLYHSGLTSGSTENTSDNVGDEPFIDEITSQRLFRNNNDGTELVIQHHRIKGCSPNESTCISSTFGMDSNLLNRGSAASWKHTYIFHTDTSGNVAPTTSGTNVDWEAPNGDNIEFKTFMSSPTITSFSVPTTPTGSPYYFLAGGTSMSTDGMYQVRVTIPTTQTSSFYSLLNVFSIGDNDPSFTYTEVNDNSGNEDAHGVEVETSDEHVLAMFSSEEKTASFTSSVSNGKPVYDSQRFSKAAALHLFTEGSTVQFTINDTKDIAVYITGLDTTKSWTFTSNDGTETCSNTLATAGVCTFTVSSDSATQNITWSASGTPAPDCDDSCSLCSSEGSVGTPLTCLGSALTCYWHNNDGTTSTQCNATQANSTLCAAGDRSKCNQSTCASNGWCWENSQCSLSCAPPPAEVEETLIATEDIMLRSDQEDTNQNTNGLDVLISSASSLSVGSNTSSTCDDCDSRTVSFTTQSCSNSVLIVHVGTEEVGDTTPDSVAWNGDALTLGVADSYWNGEKSSLYYILNPDVGTYNLTLTYTASSSVDIVVGMVQVCGLEQQAPEASCNGEDSCSITTVTNNAFVIGGISNVQSATNTVTGVLDTQVYNKTSGAGGMNATLAYGIAETAGAQTCGFTNSITGNRSGTACLSFKVASAGSGATRVSCVKFDTSSLPDSISVQSADVRFKADAMVSGTGDISLFKGLRAWNETQATWNAYTTGNAWQTSGASGSSDIDGNYVTGSGRYSVYTLGGAETTGDTISFTLNATGLSYIQDNTEPSEYVNFCLHQTGSESSASFYDFDNVTPSNRPSIYVTYNVLDEVVTPVLIPKRSINGGKIIGRWGG